ncbi:MAG: type II secretion system protein [Candidatus Nomurabacteria bacterium]|nr:MAG: type II secretion system protein [Candidatus Nomurabacteria bacterium]
MIELVVSIAIFGILAGILGWNFSRFRENDDLRLAAEQLMTDLRTAQNTAMTGQVIDDPGPGDPAVPIGGYGIHFNLNIGNNEYWMFADRESYSGTTCVPVRNERFDQLVADPPSTCMTDGVNDDLDAAPNPVQLPGDVIIEALRVDGTQSITDVAFLPPKPLPYVAYGDLTNAAVAGKTIEIDLRHTVTNQLRRVTVVGASGQISVSTP